MANDTRTGATNADRDQAAAAARDPGMFTRGNG